MRKRYLFVTLLVVTLLLPFSIGCGSQKTLANIRYMRNEATQQLMAMQQARREADPKALEKAKDPKQLEQQGDRMAFAGENTAAIFQYSRALGLSEDFQRKNLIRGKIALLQLRNHNYSASLHMFAQVVKHNPENAEAWQGLGMARMATGDMTGAIKALNWAVGLEPDRWKAHNGLGIIYNRLKRPDMALASFQRALSMAPGEPMIHNNCGLAYLLKRDYQQAEECFVQALTLKSDYKLAANNLGMLYARQGRLELALRAFERSMGIAQAHHNLGVFLTWRKKYDLAAYHFQKAIETMPRYYQRARRKLLRVQRLSGNAEVLPWMR